MMMCTLQYVNCMRHVNVKFHYVRIDVIGEV